MEVLKSAGKAQQREILPRWNYSLENVEVLKSAGKAQQREILPRWNYSLDLARDVHVRTFYFGFIALILLYINQSLKTQTEGCINTVK